MTGQTSSIMSSPTLQSHASQTLLHSILFLFTLIFLPRQSYPYKVGSSDAPPQTKSADKPQTVWLNPLTFDTRATLLWWILGSTIICIFRASWIRSSTNSNKETKTKGDVQRKALFVRLVHALITPVLLTPFTTILLALMGAPLTSDPFRPNVSFTSSTPLLALLLNVLVFFIPCYAIGLPLSIIGELVDSLPALSILGISSKLLGGGAKPTEKDLLREKIQYFILISSVIFTPLSIVLTYIQDEVDNGQGYSISIDRFFSRRMDRCDTDCFGLGATVAGKQSYSSLQLTHF